MEWTTKTEFTKRCIQAILALAGLMPTLVCSQTITPSDHWKSRIEFALDPFITVSGSETSVRWVKFALLAEPYDPNVVYFQNSRRYVFHYSFATACLDPFLGMTTDQFNAVSLFKQNQQAILGTVIVPPQKSFRDRGTNFDELGIQFVRQDPYTPEEIRDMFNIVRAAIDAPADLQAFYFPTYEQQAVAAAQADWFASQGMPLGSTARWAKGNTCYAEGWALGTLKYIDAGDIDAAYNSGRLEPQDILLTNGIPAELPYVAGIVSLVPSTPNSHVAILARTYGVPFVHLLLAEDAELAQNLVGHRIVFSAYNDEFGACETRLIDTDHLLDNALAAQILELKQPNPLALTPITPYGAYGVSTWDMTPDQIGHVGGKAANFGILHASVPENSPRAAALTFDLWQAFLDQALVTNPRIELGPGEHILIWADSDEDQGPLHTGFRLNRAGESVALFGRDGHTLIDVLHFDDQNADVSYGRITDGSDTWQSFSVPTPGRANSAGPAVGGEGLVINEIMALNRKTIEDPNRPGQYPDWIELYNTSDSPIVLNGLYLTDDVNNPTRWQVPVAIGGASLREEIARRLSQYSYPPEDMQALTGDLASIRNLFTNAGVTQFSDAARAGILAALSDPEHGFNAHAPLRFRSSTNVEDSTDFVGAGLYDSYSGCLADELDGDSQGPSLCDPNRPDERGVFRAIRRVMASFYNDNAFLERLRHQVDESEVGMAVLVHHSFPDEIELANGVATVERVDDIWSTGNTVLTLVSQQGAISVTNPLDASVPEEVIIEVSPSGYVSLPRAWVNSSRVPLGAKVMTWPDDYEALTDLLVRVSDQFSQVTGKTSYILDLEYKKVAPGGEVLPAGGLVVKQVRQVPTPDEVPSKTPFLLNVPLELEVFTGEVGLDEMQIDEAINVFGSHRLKSRWTLETRNMPLDNSSLNTGLYTHLQLEYLDQDQVATLSLPMDQLLTEHNFGNGQASDSWHLADLAIPRTFTLMTTGIPALVSSAENPIVILADLGTFPYQLPYKCLSLDVKYARPVLSWRKQVRDTDPPSGPNRLDRNRVWLWPRQAARPDDIFETRSFSAEGVTIETSFYSPVHPTQGSSWANATKPLKRWDGTLIQGLTSEPIVLKGYYAQTFKADHHNLTEHFLFEPRLEPDISADILAELRDMDIRLVHLFLDNTTADPGDPPHEDQSAIMTYGFDSE